MAITWTDIKIHYNVLCVMGLKTPETSGVQLAVCWLAIWPGMRSPHFLVGLRLQGFKKLGLRLQPVKILRLQLLVKSDTNFWTCVIVTMYWVNDADRQIATNNRPCIRGLVYYALSIISLYSVRLWKQVRPMRSPLFWQVSDSGIFLKIGLRLWPWAGIQTPNPHPRIWPLRFV